VDCETIFDWADGTYRFALRLRELEELQEKLDCGPMALFKRVKADEWRVGDLRETIRLGLIGGGQKPEQALTLVRRYVDGRPLSEATLPAMAILAAAIWGVADDQPGKSGADGQAETGPAETENSASPTSMEPAP
jgi:hypothetical protein